MKDGKLIVGQIGCGAFAEGQDFLNFGKNQKTEIKWCCDISKERAVEMSKMFNIPKTTTDYMDVINDPEVDMIKICTSHDVHLPIIEAAAKNGKHIFCEKPMAMETGESLKIISAVKRGGVKLCIDTNRRMAPSLHSLRNKWLEHKKNPSHKPWRYTETSRDMLPEEKETQLLIRIQDESLSYRMIHLDPLKGGGLLIGESVHWLDLACWFFAPEMPAEITAWGSSRLSHGINIRFTNGDNATILFNCGGSFDYPKELFEVTHNGALFRNRFFVENNYYGIDDDATETFKLQHDCLPTIGTENGFDGYMKKYQHRVKNTINSKDGSDTLAVDKGHENMLNSFIDAILNDTQSPCDEFAGFSSVYLAKLATKSIELGTTLPVPKEQISPSVV